MRAPFRVLHVGDLHVTEGPRFANTLLCLDFAATVGAQHRVDLFLVGGDLSGVTVPHVATITERNALCDFFIAAADKAPVVLCYGNHDAPGDLEVYGKLDARHTITVVDRPAIHTLPLRSGEVHLAVLPYPSKRWLVAGGYLAGQDLEAQKQDVESRLRLLFDAWRLELLEARAAGAVTVALMHVNIGGSKLGGGEVLIGEEIELAPHDLEELGVHYVALSHIHRAQQMAANAWYAGSPNAQNHGEAMDVKSVNLVTIHPDDHVTVDMIVTPATRLMTVDATWTGDTFECTADAQHMRGAEVRLRVTVPEDQLATAPVDALAASLRHQGALAVVTQRIPIPKQRTRLDQVEVAMPTADAPQAKVDGRTAYTATKTLAEKIRVLWQLRASSPAPEDQERILAKLEELDA